MSEQMTRSQIFWGALQQGLQYSFVEVIFLTVFLLGRFTGDGIIAPVLLWTAFILSAGWVLLTNTNDAYKEAKAMVLEGYIFISDFLVSAMVLTLCAVVVWPQSWWFPVMLLIAVAQNLRYSHLSMNWILKDERERHENDKDKDD